MRTSIKMSRGMFGIFLKPPVLPRSCFLAELWAAVVVLGVVAPLAGADIAAIGCNWAALPDVFTFLLLRGIFGGSQ